MSIKENLNLIKSRFLNSECKLVVVSKTQSVEAIMDAYEAGIRDFGENKAQEIIDKASKLPRDIRWHMIGHMQRNKVKVVASFIHLIQSVDSLRLLKQIDKEGKKAKKVIRCLLQIHIAKEENKFGLDEGELKEIIFGNDIKKMNNIRILGLMGMATYSDEDLVIRREFSGLKKIFDFLQTEQLPDQVVMEELSMGMSGDFIVAMEEGSTMIRIGSAIFGKRNYT